MRLVQRVGGRFSGPFRNTHRVLQQTPPALRRVAAMLVDAAIVIESFAVALLFRFNGPPPRDFWTWFWPFAVFAAGVFVVLLHESGVYRSILRYTGIYQGVRTASATAIATGILFVIDFALGPDGLGLLDLNPVPLGVVLIGSLLAYVQLVAVRLYPRAFYELSLREVGRRKRVLILGAEEPAVALAQHIWRSRAMNLQVVGFLSESPELVGRRIEATPVLGTVDEVASVIERHGIDQVIVAMPHVEQERMDEIWRASTESPVEIKVMPDLAGLLDEGTVRLRELQIEDLLGREPVAIDLEALAGYVNGKRVLVTGAGGSIGSELCRQVSRLGPSRLLLLDRDESALHYLNEDLGREQFFGAETLVGDATSPSRMSFVFERYAPQIVFHAAAYKHVPLMELQATEAIANNVGGTLNVARMAGEYGAERLINISTDKAVNPISAMGATKRLSEMILQSLAHEYPETVFASVRFGNVLGSRGSVVPTFKRQIEVGGPVTVTHPDMIRYFMTIPEAVSLVLQAGAMADSYGTYVLEMGRPVRILDLAQKMIGIMGAKDVQVKYTGLRPGEKLKEELFEEAERRVETGHPMVFGLVPEGFSESDLMGAVDEMLFHARDQQPHKALELLKGCVPNYSTLPEGSGRLQGRP